MRTLPWPLADAEISAVHQRLRRDYCKWDIYHRGQPNLLPDVIVLTEREHHQLVDAARQTWLALRELEALVIESPEVLETLGVPRTLVPMLMAEGPAAPRISRCDFHLAVGGQWLISEFNEDGPGGYAEAHGLAEVLTDDWGERFPGLTAAGNLRQAMTEVLAPFGRIGLVYPTAYTEDLQQIALIADWLRAASLEAVTGSPANLVFDNDQASMFGQPVDAMFRYFPGEWIAELPNLDSWRQAAASLPMINNMAALAAQSKRFYAAADHHGLDLSETSRQVLNTWMPPSHYLTPELRARLIAEREHWVIKSAFGRMGDTVKLGIAHSPDNWATTVDRALADPEPYAVQARFDAAPLWFSSGLAYATIGLFLVDGQFAGYYSRVSPYPLINYDSCHVATLVETA
ncbi:MAG: hypothetical protein EA370_03870 [Wenzhouxiangella sp.]|nr:MAG: hypothetical protein EA370_03870 [Wenzhouxiangella sp.]